MNEKEIRKAIEKHNIRQIKIPSYWKESSEQTAFIEGVNYEFEEMKKDLLSHFKKS